MIILPLGAILARVCMQHMVKTPHGALWVFIGMDHLSLHLGLSSMF